MLSQDIFFVNYWIKTHLIKKFFKFYNISNFLSWAGVLKLLVMSLKAEVLEVPTAAGCEKVHVAPTLAGI